MPLEAFHWFAGALFFGLPLLVAVAALVVPSFRPRDWLLVLLFGSLTIQATVAALLWDDARTIPGRETLALFLVISGFVSWSLRVLVIAFPRPKGS